MGKKKFSDSLSRTFVATKRTRPKVTTEVILDKKTGLYVDREISRGGEIHGHIGGYRLDRPIDQEYRRKLTNFDKPEPERVPCECGLVHGSASIGKPEIPKSTVNLEAQRADQMAKLMGSIS